MDYIKKTKKILLEKLIENHLLEESIEIVSARSLRPEEAIGSPEREDYPILKGKEVMIEAKFLSSRGQAFTDHPGSCTRLLKDIFSLEPHNRFDNAVLIATMNAVASHFGMVEKTIHCKDDEPKRCAEHLKSYIELNYGHPKIAFIGYQPGMLNCLSSVYDLRVVDLDSENIGKSFHNVVVENACKTYEIIDWCDLIIATGSTSVNGTLMDFIGNKPVVFYGVTVSAIAQLNGLNQYCHLGH